MSSHLGHRGIVVTRPQPQADALALLLQNVGARPIIFPLIDIFPAPEGPALTTARQMLSHYAAAFFVSANAVEHFFTPNLVWPTTLPAIAVGPSTAAALHARGIATVVQPTQRFDSEGVLALPALRPAAVAGQRILVLRGNGGRELVAETLQARGAQVEVITTYLRQAAHTDPAPLLAAHAAGSLHALSFTSSEGVENFVHILGRVAARGLLADLPCFVPHPRIAQTLALQGAQQTLLTTVGDQGLITALQQHFR